MNIRKTWNNPTLVPWVLALWSIACPLSGLADEPRQTIPDPGFRPESEYAVTFVDAASTAQITVLPTIVRRVDRTAHSFSSQQQIVMFLNKSGMATAMTKPRRIDLGPLRRPSQWEMFQYGLESIAQELEAYETGTDYTLVMELLIPGDQAVFGIEVYIMDRQGRNAFSFLLNSHHELFSRAKLVAGNSSEEARESMILSATRVGLEALTAQIEQVKECIAITAATTPVQSEAGILHDFQSDLVAETSRYGNPLGFSTFSDGSSHVSISLSDAHPPLPNGTEGNAVLQLNLDVTGWAGVIHLFRDTIANTWASQDWSGLKGFSFWLYGNNSGAEMFVDLLDNRNFCSRRDDAERYTYVFLDDVAGWRLISVPFTDMFRKEIGNGAPNDELNLTEVHGWGLGATDTSGPKTYYIDDFRLWSESPTAGAKPLAEITHELFTEARLTDNSSRILIKTDRLQGLVVQKAMSLHCAIAKLTQDRGYRYFRIDERAKLSGGRGSFRVTFYDAPPEGMPVIEEVQNEELAAIPNLMTATINAEMIFKVCSVIDY